MDDRKALARLLRHIADCVEEWSAEDIDDLLAGKKHLSISAETVRNTPAMRVKSRPPETRDWLQIAERLHSLPTRDDGRKLLDDLSLTRAEFEHLARSMDLPVSKQDNAERLREKIIGASIGSRLISHAIRGT
jgi:hypothetical protein